MPSVKWIDIRGEVQLSVPGCPAPVVDNAIRNAAIELCGHGLMWRVDMDDFDTEVDLALYEVAYDSNTDVAEILSMRIGSSRLTATSMDKLAGLSSTFETDTGPPTHYYRVGTAEVMLYPIPDAIYTVKTKVALVPSRTSTQIEKFIADKYREDLNAGALTRLLDIPNTPWRSPQDALKKAAEFEKAKLSVRSAGLRDFTTTPLTVAARSFF